MTVGQRIANARRGASLTLETFAERIDMSAKYIGALERGRKHPSLATIQKIEAAFAVSLAEPT